MKLTAIYFASAAALALAACGTPASILEMKVVAARPPIPVAANETASPITFNKVQIALGRNDVIGTDTPCMAGAKFGVTHDLRYSGNVNRNREFARTFTEQLTAAGYNVVGNPDALFDNPDRSAANYEIAGLVHGLQVNMCSNSLGTSRLVSWIQVEWQVYDRLARRVVYQTTTEGNGRADTGPDTQDAALDQMTIAAFGGASRNLLADPAFHDLIVKKETNDPSTSAASTSPLVKINFVPLATKRFQDQATDIRAQVVTVFAGDGTGSGFFVNDGYVLTNEHVVEKAKFVKIRLVTGRDIVGEVVATNRQRDVAIIKTENIGIKGLPLQTTEAGVGSSVFVIGSPIGVQQAGTVSAGIVSAYRVRNGQRFIQSDANILGGNSGGPLLDDKGNVLGITVSALTPTTEVSSGVNFFIPIADALKALGISVNAPK